MIDNKEQKLETEKIKESEDLFFTLFNSSPTAIVLSDLTNGRFVEFNKEFLKLTGYLRDELIGLTSFEAGIVSDPIARERTLKSLQNKEQIPQFEVTIKQKSGNVRYGVVTLDTVEINNQEYAISNFMDITERKLAETLLKASVESPKGMIILSIDKNYNYLFFNEVHREAMKQAYNKDVEVGMNILEAITSEEDIINSKHNYDLALSGVSHSTIQEYGDMTKVYYETFYNPIINDNNEIIGATAFARDISERIANEKEIEYLIYHDQLTGRYNRRFFEEELIRLDTERNLPISIVMGDVNGLKLVNDSLGHLKGDELLKKVAIALKDACRADDIIARFGGDEFVIILPKTDKFEAEKLANRIKDLTYNYKVDIMNISISFGYESKIDVNENIIDVIKGAENHLYRRKLYEGLSIKSEMVNLIMNTLYEKNNREMLHSKRVSEICGKIAEEMNFSIDEIAKMKMAGLMHDIGKIAIDEKILNKNDKLTDNEWNEMKNHSEIGFRILSSSTEFAEIANFVLEHQEKWDGTGYPKGIKGETIKIEARIIAIADAYDAMTSSRTYGLTLSNQEAINEIEKCAGTQFDPKIAEIFVKYVMKKLI